VRLGEVFKNGVSEGIGHVSTGLPSGIHRGRTRGSHLQPHAEGEQTTELIHLLGVAQWLPLYVVGHSLINGLSSGELWGTPPTRPASNKLETLPI
jgi:hypothetical protein